MLTPVIKEGEGTPSAPHLFFDNTLPLSLPYSLNPQPSSFSFSANARFVFFLVQSHICLVRQAAHSLSLSLSLLPLVDFPTLCSPCVVSTQWPAAAWRSQREWHHHHHRTRNPMYTDNFQKSEAKLGVQATPGVYLHQVKLEAIINTTTALMKKLIICKLCAALCIELMQKSRINTF